MQEMDFYEIGRAVGTMFTDPRFRSAAYKADKPGQILQALEAFQKSTSLLPPASWDASIRLEPQAKVGSIVFSECEIDLQICKLFSGRKWRRRFG